MRVFAVGGMVALLALTSVAAARSGGDEPTLDAQNQAARDHFLAGEAAYREGRYEDAVKEFQAGYDLSPRPEFLINLAQANAKLGHNTEAIADCRRFLAATNHHPAEKVVRTLLERLESEAAGQPHAPPLSPPPAPAPAPVAAMVVAVAPTPPPKRPLVRRAWFWGVVAGGALVVGGAIALGVTLGSSRVAPTATLGSSPLQ